MKMRDCPSECGTVDTYADTTHLPGCRPYTARKFISRERERERERERVRGEREGEIERDCD